MDVTSVALLTAAANVAQPATTTLPAPDSGAIVGFQALMNSSPAQEMHAAASASDSTSPIASGSLNLGDRILAGLDKIGGELHVSMSNIESTVQSSRGMGTADLLKAQMEVVQYTLELEYVGKVMGGLTRSVDQLAKLQ